MIEEHIVICLCMLLVKVVEVENHCAGSDHVSSDHHGSWNYLCPVAINSQVCFKVTDRDVNSI